MELDWFHFLDEYKSDYLIGKNFIMTNASIAYDSSYFAERIFETDYEAIASSIVNTYQPKTVAEFGCGPGHLSRELAKLEVQVTAVDGFAQPDFSGLAVEFHQLNLNDSVAIKQFFTARQFDLAVCLEVAEHLSPKSGPTLVKWLSKVAPIIVFAAAVPGQGGHGHINLRPRDYWHYEFSRHKFVLADRLREKLRKNLNLAPWYRFNTIDYVHIDHIQAPQSEDVASRLIASESAATTAYFDKCNELNAAQTLLNYRPIKNYLSLRKFVKQILNR